MAKSTLALKVAAATGSAGALAAGAALGVPKLLGSATPEQEDLEDEEDEEIEETFKPLDLSNSADFNHLKPGQCVTNYFGEIDVTNISKTGNNWTNVNFDFDDTRNEKSKGCLSLSAKFKKEESKEDGKARWELSLKRGNYGFAFLSSLWNENGKIKSVMVIAFLKNENNVWNIKKSVKLEEPETSSSSDIINNINKYQYFITPEKTILDFNFDLDLTKLCQTNQCGNENYQLVQRRYKWRETPKGEHKFNDWNKDEGYALNKMLLIRGQQNFINLYSGVKYVQISEQRTEDVSKRINGKWTKIN